MKGECVIFLLLLLSVVLVTSLNSQTVKAEPSTGGWNRTYGGISYDFANALVQTNDGGYALAGWTDSLGAGGNGFWLVKTDADGSEQWNRTYGGASSDVAWALVQTVDGGYALAGWTDSFGAGGNGFWMVKTDADGSAQWNKTYGGTSYGFARALVQTVDGGYALAGEGFANLVKTDTDGNMQWAKSYDGAALALVQTSDGGYALAGSTSSFGAGLDDFWLVKTDADGSEQWNRTYGGASSDVAWALAQTNDGGYALAGSTGSFGAGGYDFWLVKTDANGSAQWNKTYGGISYDFANALVQTNDGGYALAGHTDSFGAGGNDLWLVKTDAVGNAQWSRAFGGTDNEDALALVQTSDGGYALAGSTSSFGAGGFDFWLIKTDGNGVVPEFPSHMLPAALLVVTSSAVILAKRKLRGSPKKPH